jgi:hypothetical protein
MGRGAWEHRGRQGLEPPSCTTKASSGWGGGAKSKKMRRDGIFVKNFFCIFFIYSLETT